MARIITIGAVVLASAAVAGAGGAALVQGPDWAVHAGKGPATLGQFLTQPIAGATLSADQVRRGQYLVTVGDCAACHTREGGAPFAGGLGLNTPFGVIYSTNLTSDPATGVGTLSPEKFYAALHMGIGPKGQPIYPAMPYPAFSHITRADSDAILTYLKTTPAVGYRRPANRLPFPLNIRFLVRGWNLLFFRPGEFTPDPGKSAEWNRGAYLVTGLGHCGACHTPKNVLGADKSGQALRGGDLDNWVAPDLTANTRIGLGQWSTDDIVEYLKTGRGAHANAAGSMAAVVSDSTSLMSDQDLRAIAAYLKDQPASAEVATGAPNADAMRRGAAIYSDACASCHMEQGFGQDRLFPPLRGDAMLQQRDPTGLIHLILAGGRTAPTPTRPTPVSMPSFAWKLTDRQVADVATYVRNSWGNQAGPVREGAAASLRGRLGLNSLRLTDNSGDHF